ncbi:transcriptional regulator GutM [Clostridium sp. BL-8]|uniref:transcriptional regulator GutM n=1 Tax=Clostridium sp. BL-8 TaxID=349938 RepID=UPI00098C55FC|nr:transcriptional regulator GutM [Clostridium sp. BL-8]OOM79697.1 DNA-binding transcriptional activator GutM [Clostridium sp. BL-8]
MNFWFLIICFGIAFIFQYILTFIQMKSFTVHYSKLRRKGRVAIGKVKGGFNAGCIAMFAINKDGIILEGSYMQGVTVFARVKKLTGFEGKDVGVLTKTDCENLSRPLVKAVLEASSNYNVIMGGGEVIEPPSPLQRLGKFFTVKKLRAHN